MEIIIREGRSERRERIYGRANRNPFLRDKISGIARCAEEAAEIASRDLRERFGKPLLVEGGPERKQAFADLHSKRGFDPSRLRHDWGEE
jgi:hypothetical protein